jgi:hypothetical protein
MITAKLKQILTDSGCTHVIYESDKLANLFTDEAMQYDTIGLIIQPNDVILEVKANAIHEHFKPITIEVMQQVRLEDTADNNEVKLQALLDVCKEIIVRLIHEAEFKTLTPVTVLKIQETKYDANVIGWALPLDLYYLKNETRDPCL